MSYLLHSSVKYCTSCSQWCTEFQSQYAQTALYPHANKPISLYIQKPARLSSKEDHDKHLIKKLILYRQSIQNSMCKKYKHTRLHLLLNYFKQIK